MANVFDYLLNNVRKPEASRYQPPRTKLSPLPEKEQPVFDPFAASPTPPVADDRVKLYDIPLPQIGAGKANDNRVVLTDAAPLEGERFGVPANLAQFQNSLPRLGTMLSDPAPSADTLPAPLTSQPLPPGLNNQFPTFGAKPMEFLAPPAPDEVHEPDWKAQLPIIGANLNQNENLTPSQATAAQVNAINNKQYGFEKNEDGSYKLDAFGHKILAKDAAKHHDFKEALKGIGIGALAGLQNYDPRTGVGGLIGAAIGGGAAGGISEATDRDYLNKVRDQKELAQLLPRFGQQAAMENEAAKQQNLQYAGALTQEQTKKAQAEGNAATSRAQTARDTLTTQQAKIAYDSLNDAQKNIIEIYKNLPEFDPESEHGKVLATQAENFGIKLPAKSRSDRFSLQIAPDGTPIIVNSSTGEIKRGEGNYGKPTQISASTLPDELFSDIGLKSEKDITDAAVARIGKLPDDRRIKPEISNSLLKTKDADGNFIYQNSDGSLNESKVLTDISDGVAPVRSIGDLYENLPSSYEQNLASARNNLRGGQKVISQKVAEFRTNIGNYKPSANAQTQPLHKVVDLFKAIMKLPPKARETKLKIFYDNLPNIRIQ